MKLIIECDKDIKSLQIEFDSGNLKSSSSSKLEKLDDVVDINESDNVKEMELPESVTKKASAKKSNIDYDISDRESSVDKNMANLTV